jgi:hypothetical protein
VATVAFEPEELSQLIRAYTGEGIARDELQEFVESLRQIERAPRALDAVMEQANDYFYALGVEYMYEPEGEGLMGEGAILGAYIAFEDRPRAPGAPPLQSDRTLLYDWRENTFRLTTPDEFWRNATEGEGATHTRASEHVRIDRGEFGRIFANQWRVDASAIQRLYNEMHDAIGMREIRAVLRRINDAANQHGVESVAPERNAGRRALVYINTGDTYDETIGFDEGADAFIITTWGGWLEEAEREINEEGEPARNDEDVCVGCGRIYLNEELDYDDDGTGATCRNCRKPEIPIWHPGNVEPLVAILRALGGEPIAVHCIDRDPLTLAFSFMQTADHLIAEREEFPFKIEWATLLRLFVTEERAEWNVCGTGRYIHTQRVQPDLSIEREMFQRLYVAMDAFLGTGAERQPVAEFLKMPPVLWTCGQVNEIQWIEGERGEDGGVQAFVRQHHEPGSQIEFDDLVVWSAAGDELRELITDGFIAWNRDDTVRAYLKSIGVCR